MIILLSWVLLLFLLSLLCQKKLKKKKKTTKGAHGPFEETKMKRANIIVVLGRQFEGQQQSNELVLLTKAENVKKKYIGWFAVQFEAAK